MRPRFALVAALLVVVAWFALDLGRVAAPPPPPPRARPRQPARAAVALPDRPERNVFEFVNAPPAPRAAPSLEPPPPALVEAPVPPPGPNVRLVGLVRSGGALRAALAVAGETVVVGAGDAAGDYRVMGVDEDGVRLRAPDGSTLVLAVRPGS